VDPLKRIRQSLDADTPSTCGETDWGSRTRNVRDYLVDKAADLSAAGAFAVGSRRDRAASAPLTSVTSAAVEVAALSTLGVYRKPPRAVNSRFKVRALTEMNIMFAVGRDVGDERSKHTAKSARDAFLAAMRDEGGLRVFSRRVCNANGPLLTEKQIKGWFSRKNRQAKNTASIQYFASSGFSGTRDGLSVRLDHPPTNSHPPSLSVRSSIATR
jgi:hypothetical protein